MSCLPSAFSGSDFAGRVRCILPRASTVRLLRVHTHEGLRVLTLDGCKTCFAGSQIRRPALQAARYICSPWRTQVRDHGFDRVLFLSAAAEREIIPSALRHKAQIERGNQQGEDLRSSRRKHHLCRPERFVSWKDCSLRTVPTYEGNTLHLAILLWDGRDLAENLLLHDILFRLIFPVS